MVKKGDCSRSMPSPPEPGAATNPCCEGCYSQSIAETSQSWTPSRSVMMDKGLTPRSHVKRANDMDRCSLYLRSRCLYRLAHRLPLLCG